MQEPSTVHSTFVIERSFPKQPQRVFSLFADPAEGADGPQMSEARWRTL